MALTFRGEDGSSLITTICLEETCHTELLHLGSVYLKHSNYSGVETASFYECPSCKTIYQQVDYTDPSDNSSNLHQLEECSLTGIELAYLLEHYIVQDFRRFY